MPQVSIIIPTKDRGDIFRKTYERMVNVSAHLDAEILIINNSLSPVVVAQKPANVFIHDNPNNKDSVFSSRNYGGGIARSPILLFVDDDILVTKESLDCVVSFYTNHGAACLNVNWVYPPDLMEKIKKTVFGRYLIKHGFSSMKSLYGKGWDDNMPFKSNSLASFFFAIRKSDFEKIGGYDERHLHEGTDVDITNRLHKNGIETWINPLVMVFHNEKDRTELVNWLERKKRLGQVLGHSKNMPDIAQDVHYSLFKRTCFWMIYLMQPMLLGFIRLLDSFKLDFMGFFFIDALLGANMCHGYYSVGK